MNRTDRTKIRRALAYLPETCRYHGTQLDREGPFGPACCDSGWPAWRRREALTILNDEAVRDSRVADLTRGATAGTTPGILGFAL